MKTIIRECTKKPIKVNYVTFEDFNELVDKYLEEGIILPTYKEILNNECECDSIVIVYPDCYKIATLESDLDFTKEDVLIIGVQGEIYPCKKDIFKETYV